jgi:lipopolysaccharide transport system permease protein
VIRWVVRSLVHNWDLLWQMVSTDLRGRYVGSTLGLFWSVIHPLVMIAIYTLVFSHLMASRLPGSTDRYAYGLFLCAGLLPWLAFQELIARATTLFPDNANLVRKVAFPKAVLYGFVTLSTAVTLGVSLSVFLAAYLLTGHLPHPSLALWAPLLALQLGFGLGIGIIASVVHVFVRDTAQLVGVMLQVWFWLTPIVYGEGILPPWLQRLERLNPLHLFCTAHRALVLEGTPPSVGRLTALTALTAVTLAAGTLLYRRFRSDILDEL